MRFGRDLHRHRVPAWASQYIDYDGIKQRLKIPQATPIIIIPFKQELQRVEVFLAKQVEIALKWAHHISNRFGIDIALPSNTFICDIDPTELADLKRSILEYARFLSQLDSYAKINQDIIRRLNLKLSRRQAGPLLCDKESILYRQPWLQFLGHSNVLLGHIEETLTRPSDYIQYRSLLLETHYSTVDNTLLREIRALLVSDGSSDMRPILTLLQGVSRWQYLRNTFLEVAILHQSFESVRFLLDFDSTLAEEDGGNGFIHHVVVNLANAQKSNPRQRSPSGLDDLLETALATESITNRFLCTKDFRGRLPLHYAASLGLIRACQMIFLKMDKKAFLEPDSAGDTPVLLAASGGYVEIVQSFIQIASQPYLMSPQIIHELLVVTIESGYSDAASALVTTIKECLGSPSKLLDYRNELHHTPLYVAARRGYNDIVKQLLITAVDVNSRDRPHSRTPLMIATIQGHLDVVQTLVDYGADIRSLDNRGWSALDHAAYRGYLKIAATLRNADLNTNTVQNDSTTSSESKGGGTHHMFTALEPEEQHLSITASGEASTLFVNLGSFNLFKSGPALDITPYEERLCPKQLPQSSLKLHISMSDCIENYCVRLPVVEDLSNIPWRFSILEPDGAKLVFKLLGPSATDTGGVQSLCTGIALLDEFQQPLGPQRETLVRDHTIPLITTDGDFAGTLTFTYLLACPLPAGLKLPRRQYLSQSDTTHIGGHRGTGQNTKQQNHLQIGENTIQSFETATTLGSSFIELDVQVTKDLVPVIYHDFLVSETGTDAPMHTLSFAQFMALSEAQSPQFEDDLPRRLPWDERERPRVSHRRRARSLTAPPQTDTDALLKRIKYTFEYSVVGMKGNIRSQQIHDSFVTLRQVLEDLPESVVFSIELKYPMLSETDDWKMEPSAMELNIFLDTILGTLFEFGRGRRIFLSSFSPELCIALVTKQQAYPVLFLNDSSNGPTGDPRALSVQSALHFARAWGLRGVVMASEPFTISPKLIQFVRNQRMFCASYGAQNDDPRHVKVQTAAGIDALIVNKVGELVAQRDLR